MDGQRLKQDFHNLDSCVEGGVFMSYDGHHELYDVRKAGAFFKELGLQPGDELPAAYKDLCVL